MKSVTLIDRTPRVAACCIAVACGLFFSRPALAVESVAGTWAFVQGRVTVAKLDVDKTLPARAGDAVFVGDLLETGKDSRAQISLADGSVAIMSTGTALRLTQYTYDPATGRRSAVVKLTGGKARFTVVKRKESRFMIETPDASIAVGNGADVVALAARDATTVFTLDGGANVKNSSDLLVSRVDLWPNQTTVVRHAAAPAHPAEITPQQRKEYRRDVARF